MYMTFETDIYGKRKEGDKLEENGDKASSWIMLTYNEHEWRENIIILLKTSMMKVIGKRTCFLLKRRED